MSEVANIPVLGLSNKAVDQEVRLEEADIGEFNEPYTNPTTQALPLDLDHPPLEDHLSRYSLWPELEKLYGHGYEISAVAASHDRDPVAGVLDESPNLVGALERRAGASFRQNALDTGLQELSEGHSQRRRAKGPGLRNEGAWSLQKHPDFGRG